jgi:hypothetical protein
MGLAWVLHVSQPATMQGITQDDVDDIAKRGPVQGQEIPRHTENFWTIFLSAQKY